MLITALWFPTNLELSGVNKNSRHHESMYTEDKPMEHISKTITIRTLLEDNAVIHNNSSHTDCYWVYGNKVYTILDKHFPLYLLLFHSWLLLSWQGGAVGHLPPTSEYGWWSRVVPGDMCYYRRLSILHLQLLHWIMWSVPLQIPCLLSHNGWTNLPSLGWQCTWWLG